MSSLQFQYEIPVDEYVAAQLLYYRSLGRKRHVWRAACWILTGAVCVVIAVSSVPPAPSGGEAGLALVLLAAIGIWWMWAGVGMLFLARHFRRAYSSSQVAGKSYKAEADEAGFVVVGEFCEWRIKWPAAKFKNEDERVFLFLAAGTLYIFGKKFLTSDQQEELRRVSGLKS